MGREVISIILLNEDYLV